MGIYIYIYLKVPVKWVYKFYRDYYAIRSSVGCKLTNVRYVHHGIVRRALQRCG